MFYCDEFPCGNCPYNEVTYGHCDYDEYCRYEEEEREQQCYLDDCHADDPPVTGASPRSSSDVDKPYILTRVSVRDLTKNCLKNPVTDVITAYDGRLTIYPHLFVMTDEKKQQVRDQTISYLLNGFPLPAFYASKTDDGMKVIYGQERATSICQYVNGEFSIIIGGFPRYFYNLTDDEKNKILDYKLDVFALDGTHDGILDFLRIVYSAEKLKEQELRNALYSGPWVLEAQKRFSSPNCDAKLIAEEYLIGSPVRQDYLETAIRWIADRDGVSIEEYMTRHQYDSNAYDLWDYFSSVIEWVKATHPVYHEEQKGVEWGYLYNEHIVNNKR